MFIAPQYCSLAIIFIAPQYYSLAFMFIAPQYCFFAFKFIALNLCRNLNESKDEIIHVPQVKNLGQVKVINLTFDFLIFFYFILI